MTQHIASLSAENTATSCVRGRRAPGRVKRIRNRRKPDLHGGERACNMII
ncbi:hypothetical protein BVM94_004667, partial [Salmonella enterica subsp. enterica serovar Anatum]|nr:hypothetical protein [Salmonella enterica subsp. enterica serovar Anatum]